MEESLASDWQGGMMQCRLRCPKKTAVVLAQVLVFAVTIACTSATTCGDMKEAYRDNACCGTPSKEMNAPPKGMMGVPESIEEMVSQIGADKVGDMLKSPLTPSDGPDGDYAGYDIDSTDFRKYANGQHRRPTDPPTKAEILMVQNFVFGAQLFSDLAEADALYEATHWQSLQPALQAAGVGGMHPATVRDILNRDGCASYSGDSFEALVDAQGVQHAFNQLLANAELRCATQLWHAKVVGVEVPDRQHVLDVEEAIEAGDTGYTMKRILSMMITGGYSGKTNAPDGDHTEWGYEILIAVDVANPANLQILPEYLEVYEVPNKHGLEAPTKGLDDASSAYLQTAMSALYLEFGMMPNQFGLPINFLPKYNGLLGDFIGVGNDYILKHVTPFKHLYGDAAYTYGKNGLEWIYSAELTSLKQAVPIDGHQVSSGGLIATMPLTFQYAIDHEKNYVNPEQTLPGFDGTPAKSAAMTWYGRGLTFNQTAGFNLLGASIAHMGASDMLMGTPLEPFVKEVSATMYVEVVAILTHAIREAWGDEEALPGTGFRPGEIARTQKHGSEVDVPSDIVKHSADQGSYVNHATRPDFVSEGSPFTPPGATRDARDNPDFMAPPLDANGSPQYAPNGPPFAKVDYMGSAYTVDGYAVTYNVGMKWKFLISFDRQAGLTFWNVRMQLPPSKENPEGKTYPLLFRANVPNFGTDYATNGMGSPQGSSFLESHYDSATATLNHAACKGQTLPIFKHNGGGGPHLRNGLGLEFSSYSTLGVPGVVDPVFGLPMEGFNSFVKDVADDTIIAHAICLDERSSGPSNWHMYTLQQERCLSVTTTAISEAYNMMVLGEFCNTGHMFIGQNLHGKPAIASGIAGIEGVGGAYASGGKGGFAQNHMHWSVVALEGLGAANILEVVDSEEDETDIYGMAFNQHTRRVDSASDNEKLSYNYQTGRFYRLAGMIADDMKSADDKLRSGLKIESKCWGSKIRRAPANDAAGIPLDRTYYGNHWWLRDRDVFVLPVNQSHRKRDTMDLLSPGQVGQHYDLKRSTAHAKEGGEAFGESFAMYPVLKMRHEVAAEELPIQAGFKKHGLMLKPHFLHGFNMNILMRYDPNWNRFFQNNFLNAGGQEYVDELSYTSEFSS